MQKGRTVAKSLIKLAKLPGMSPEKLAKAFVVYASERHLEYMIPTVLKYLHIAGNHEEKQMSLRIVSSHDLSATSSKRIAKYLDAKEATQDVRIDPDIIGGFIAHYNGYAVDASIAGALARIEKELLA